MGSDRQSSWVAAGPNSRHCEVGTTMTGKNKSVPVHPGPVHPGQSGFTLIEVMISIVIMTVGLLAVLASFATAITATASAQEDLIARHKALDAMKSIYTARNSQQLSFAKINNIANGGVFVGGPTTLQCAGADGLVGTADDVPCT